MRRLLLLLLLSFSTSLVAESYLDNKHMLIDTDAAYYINRNFGVGTMFPSANLHIVGTTYVSGDLKLSNAPSSSRLILEHSSGDHGWMFTDELGYLGAAPGTLGILRYNPETDAVYVTASVFLSPSGNLGMGMVDPLQPLGIGGGAYHFDLTYGMNWQNDPGGGSGDDAYVQFYQDGGVNDYALRFVITNDGDDDIVFRQAGATRLQVANSSVTIQGGAYASLTSDKRLKKNVQPIQDALEIVSQLRGVTYYWKDDTPYSRQVGVVAQEVQAVLPHQVHENKEGILGVAYEELVPLLTEALKERELKIQQLERRLEALK